MVLDVPVSQIPAHELLHGCFLSRQLAGQARDRTLGGGTSHLVGLHDDELICP